MTNYTTYENMPTELQKRNTFHGASTTEINGDLYFSVYAINDTKHYIVYSYATQILKIDLNTNTGIYNATFYSATTKKLQSILENYILPKLENIKYKKDLGMGAVL